MKFDSKKYSQDLLAIRDYALRTVVDSSNRTTPPALEKQLVEKFGISRKRIKSVVRELVANGEIAYTYEYGCTFLERSFARPVRVSKHIVLNPPGHHHDAGPDDVVVQINPGASFGAGNHPTTRLAIKGIDFVLLEEQLFDNISDMNILDIGTGSGVLLIAAVLCGGHFGLGIDVDACARSEAAENVKVNGLSDRVVISGQSVSEISQRFSLILANLRYPSLKKMLFEINQLAAATCYLVLSGIRKYELDDLINTYANLRFEKIWIENEQDWSGVVLKRLK